MSEPIVLNYEELVEKARQLRLDVLEMSRRALMGAAQAVVDTRSMHSINHLASVLQDAKSLEKKS